MPNAYTHVCTEAEVGYDVHVCNDCGAHAETPDKVAHYSSCVAGEHKHWERYYEQANNEEHDMAYKYKLHRVIVAGGRDFNDYNLMSQKLCKIFMNLIAQGDRIEIVSGTAGGADKLGERFAKDNQHSLRQFPANWRPEGKFDRGAGFKRNDQMAQYATHLVAFWDGKSRGTAHMIRTAEEYKLNVRIIRY